MMENREYQSGKAPVSRRPGGPGGEKAKNLVGTWKKLLGYCKKYMAAILIAVICAAVGTIFTLVGPDKLSDITDCITDGIRPDTEKMEEITEKVSENLTDNLELVMGSITANLKNASPVGGEMPEMEVLPQIEALPEGSLAGLPADIEVNGSCISGEDQMRTMEIMAGLETAEEEAALQALDELPESVKNALYTDIEIDGITISGGDQMEMLDLFFQVDMDNQEALLDALEQLPDSIYSLIKPSVNLERIFQIGMLLVTLYVLSYVCSALQGWLMATVTQRVSKQMRTDISHKINSLPMSYYNKTSTGDVLSRVTNDVDMIGQSLNQSISMLVSAVVLLVGSFIMMLVTNVAMTLTAVVASLIGFLFMFLIMGRSQKYFARQQKHLGRLNGHVEEIYSGHTVVKAYNGEENAAKTFDKMNEDLRVSGFRAQCLAGLMQPIMAFIGNLGYVAVCVVGGALALNGKISFGVIVAFMIYVRYFTQPFSQIAQAMQSLQSAAAAGERVFEFLEAKDMEDESEKTKQLSNTKGTVEFDHVKFGYEDSDRIIIHDFSASAKPGQKIAIVGPTGAGKTTMVNLLMRFHEIQDGEIRIDGVPTKNMTRQEVHDQFCMVLQDTWLFEGTVRENLVYCTENVSDEKISEACKAVGLDHFIRTLPHGYDTVLNDENSLSEGQKQQLTIARAMIADKPMLILDEATSSVDTRTEQQIQNAMDKLMENRTSFVIAHRLSTIKNSDLILVMKEGDIIESGTHDELLEENGFYAELYNSQFEQAS